MKQGRYLKDNSNIKPVNSYKNIKAAIWYKKKAVF